MLLTNRNDSFEIPHTSTCIIHTKGIIKNGDVISVTSPIFSSINFSTKAIDISETFDIVVKMTKDYVENNLPDGEFKGTLVCDDNDVFNMYIRL